MKTNKDIVRGLADHLGVMLGHIACEDREPLYLTIFEMARIEEIRQAAVAHVSCPEEARTGPYGSLDEMLLSITRSALPRMLKRLYVVVNRLDSTYAWYCDPTFFRRGDELIETLTWQEGGLVRCPLI